MHPDAVWDGEWGQSSDGCIIRLCVGRRREGSLFGVILGRPIETNGDFVA